jgi:hypothetical protein
MENLNDIILESEQKLKEQRNKLSIFNGKSNINNLTAEQAIIINEVSISLFFLLDKFPIIMLETLESKELESVNNIEKEIKEIQARIMEILGNH